MHVRVRVRVRVRVFETGSSLIMSAVSGGSGGGRLAISMVMLTRVLY